MLLAEKNFRHLWIGQICSQFGDRLTQLILVALVASRDPGSTLSLAKVMAATSLPALFMNPIAGAYVDRWDRRRTMIGCDLLRACLILSLPWLAGLAQPLFLYGAVFCFFSVATFFVPARLALVPDLVESRQLLAANSLLTTSGMIGSTGILLIGALLVEWAGPRISSWLNAVSYLGSALFIVPILTRRKHPTPPQGSSRYLLREIAEGMGQIFRHPATRRVALLLSLLMGGAGASIVVATVLIQQNLGSVTRDLGFSSLWIAIGMLLGSLIHSRWGGAFVRREVLGVSFLGCGVALWLFVAAVIGFRSETGMGLACVLLGFCVAPVGIIANTLVHERQPERLHGRIFSSLGVVVNVSLIVSMLSAGWLAEQGGQGLVLSAIGLVFAVSGLGLCYTKKALSVKKGEKKFYE